MSVTSDRDLLQQLAQMLTNDPPPGPPAPPAEQLQQCRKGSRGLSAAVVILGSALVCGLGLWLWSNWAHLRAKYADANRRVQAPMVAGPHTPQQPQQPPQGEQPQMFLPTGGERDPQFTAF